METANPVRKFFDARAADYQLNSNRWPWKWLRERESAVLMDALGDVSSEDVLDMGCGAGYYTRRILQAGARHVTAVDFSPEMVACLPGSKVKGIVADTVTFQAEKKHSLIVCAGLIEFVGDPEALLSNLRNNSGKGGALALLAPEKNVFGCVYRLFHRKNGLSINLFAVDDIEGLCQRTEWTLEATERVWPFTIVMRLRNNAG